MFGEIADHLTIGCKYIAVPYLDEATRPGSAGFAHAINVIYQFAACAAKRTSSFCTTTTILSSSL